MTVVAVMEHLETVEHHIAGVRPEDWRRDPTMLAVAAEQAISIARELAATFEAIALPHP